MMKQININASVFFRLTGYGKLLLQNDTEFRIWSNRVGTDYQMQIHEFARIVGPHLQLGKENVVVNCMIYVNDYSIENRDLTESLKPDD